MHPPHHLQLQSCRPNNTTVPHTPVSHSHQSRSPSSPPVRGYHNHHTFYNGSLPQPVIVLQPHYTFYESRTCTKCIGSSSYQPPFRKLNKGIFLTFLLDLPPSQHFITFVLPKLTLSPFPTIPALHIPNYSINSSMLSANITRY